MSEPRHRPRAAVCGLLAAALLALPTGGCGNDTGSGPPGYASDGFDGGRAFADLRAQVGLGPRPAGSAASRRLTADLARELRRAGVRDVRIQRPLRNVVGTIPGRGDGYVVLGAHHDTVRGIPGFAGANDGASGVAAVLELARALPNPMPGPSVAIALFDGEEALPGRDFDASGLRGSRQYLDYARSGRRGSPPIERIEAMVLLDMVGDCDLSVPREENSDEGLFAEFAAADPGLFDGRTGGIDDDHTPFLEAGIPAVDLIDFTYGPGASPGDWWHTSDDDLGKVCPGSLDRIGGAVLEALPGIGERPSPE
ncbi:MAG: M28 family peptidase [Solirubrobacterales bacterium]